MAGSAFRTVIMIPEEDFTLLSGEMKTYVKTAESGNKRAQLFCPDCGTNLYATSVGDGPKVFGVRLGTVTQRDQFTPKRQIWTRSAQHWLDDISDIPAAETQ